MDFARSLDPAAEDQFFSGLRFAGEFFMGASNVHRALDKIVHLLEEDGIPYAIIGAMALNEFGYRRATEDVNVLLSRAGLDQFKQRHIGRGYVENSAGSKGLRDTVHDVGIDIVLAGDYPGDGAPKPVCFPDPGEQALVGERIRLLPLAKIIELKLASGLTAPHRLRDLADVLELIRINHLPDRLAEELDPMVRAKYAELWLAAQHEESE